MAYIIANIEPELIENFDQPAFSNFGDAAWGKITGLATQMRQIQFALKLLFRCGARFSVLARTSVRAPT
jgi:hypothetical protein